MPRVKNFQKTLWLYCCSPSWCCELINTTHGRQSNFSSPDALQSHSSGFYLVHITVFVKLHWVNQVRLRWRRSRTKFEKKSGSSLFYTWRLLKTRKLVNLFLSWNLSLDVVLLIWDNRRTRLVDRFSTLRHGDGFIIDAWKTVTAGLHLLYGS